MGEAAPIGRVREIWRHPVQSMRGERIAATVIDPTGLRGDRAYAIADPESGERVSSAQGKRAWRGIVRLGARYLGEPGESDAPVEIVLPDGRTLRSGAADLEDALSRAIGRSVRFVRRAEAPCAYAHAPLHLLTTASLAAFRRHYPADFAPQRFRPNLVIDADGAAGFVENGWVGRRLAIGREVALRVSEHCPRCIMTVLAQGDLPQEPAVLQTVTEANDRRAGVYAEVLAPGRIAEGDPVCLLD